ncbi:MAG: HEAT repeat domain-containing protein [Chloroflexaceae bacterium]|nr:HEAT repeat domain-containing protein [bacterium]NJO07546.1 HEAT repeat domain-containing protein [Chloroflexaceae bacterium]
MFDSDDYALPPTNSVDPIRLERFASMLRRRPKPAMVVAELRQWGDDALVLVLNQIEAYRSGGERMWLMKLLDHMRDLQIDALSHVNLGIRYHAALVLGELREPQALPFLATYLNAPHIGVRRRVLAALEALGDRRAAAPVLALLQDPDTAVRLEAIATLAALGEHKAVVALTPLLTDADPNIHSEAARAVRVLGGPKALTSLTALLTDPTDTIRTAAARELGELGSHAAVPALLDCLHDPNPRVRAETASALGQIGDPQAIPDLLSLLNDTATYVVGGEFEYPVNMDVAYALGMIGEPHVVEPLLNTLAQLPWRNDTELPYPYAETFCAIIVALGRLAERSVLPRLNHILLRMPEEESQVYGDPEEVVREALARIHQRHVASEVE